MTKAPNPFDGFDSSPEVIRLVVMMYLSARLYLTDQRLRDITVFETIEERVRLLHN